MGEGLVGSSRFIRDYYNSLMLKLSILFVINMIVKDYLRRNFDVNGLFFLGVLIVLFISFIWTSMLRKETKDYVSKQSFSDSQYICNLHKWDGPTFGIFTISDEYLEFKPFKEDLKDQAFKISTSVIGTYNFDVKHRRFTLDRLFFDVLTKELVIWNNSKRYALQMSNTEEVFEEVNKLFESKK